MTDETKQQLLALADRVEAATGADREIDGAIDRLVNKRPKDGDYDQSERALWQVRDGYSGLLVRGDGFARGSFCAPAYTASIDAAMSLVPDGTGFDVNRYWLASRTVPAWMCEISTGGIPSNPRKVHAAHDAHSAALAICAAALRARALTIEGAGK
jgi:hypothetical protein